MHNDNMSIDERLDIAVHWLLFSGIQQTDENCQDYGGFKAWAVNDTEEYSYTYPETTGYALSILSMLYQNQINQYHNQISFSLKAALRFLIRTCLNDENGNFTVQDMSNGISGRAYTFDAGIILKGLLHSNKVLKDEAIVNICHQLGNWILQMRNSDGLFYAFYDRELGEKVCCPERWSLQSGSFLFKLAIPFIDLYELNGDKRYINCIYDCLETILHKQDEKGRFITDANEKSTFLHAHCYTLEGLLAFKLFEDDPYISRAIERGVSWLVKIYKEHNYVPSVVYENGKILSEQRSDIIAQTLRIVSVVGEDYKAQRELMRILFQFQARHDYNGYGGFQFHHLSENESVIPNKQNHINTWSTIAAIHTLHNINSTLKVIMEYFA